MKILITGGNGFIGSHLCEFLTNEGYEVTSLDIKFGSNTKHLDCKKITLDINQNSISEVIQDSDLVIHLAAISRVDDAQANPIKCFEVNVMGVLRILEALKNSNTRLIFSSSREVYGEPNSVPVKESDQRNPLSVYGSSKLAAEQLLKTYSELYGLKFVTLRLANVYGSDRDLPQRVIPRFIDSSRKNIPLTINGGNQIIDFTFIDDVIDGINKVIKKISNDGLDYCEQEYNFSTTVGTSIADLAKLIKKIFNSNSELTFNKARIYDVQNFVGDYKKAKNAFDFEPKYSLEEGLEKYKTRLNQL